MGRVATALKATSVGPQRTHVPLQGDERDVALEFSAVIIPFNVGELSQAARRTKEAAKKWKQGRSLPSVWSLLKMANEIPEVKAWVASKLGLIAANPGDHLQFMTPQMLDATMAAIHQVSKQNNPDGEALRAALGRMARRET